MSKRRRLVVCVVNTKIDGVKYGMYSRKFIFPAKGSCGAPVTFLPQAPLPSYSFKTLQA